MNTLQNRLTVCLFFINTLFLSVSAQNARTVLNVEELPESEAADMKATGNCHPGNLVFTVKSDIPDLQFESTEMDFAGITYDAVMKEYVFCHDRASFHFSIFSARHLPYKTFIDASKVKYAFKVTENAPLGKIVFDVKPKNAYIDFGLAGQSQSLSGAVITQNAGTYKVRVSKYGYLSVDTTVLVPSDGTTNYISLALKEDFARISLDITALDNAAFQVLPLVEIDTAHINMADLYDPTKKLSVDDHTPLQYFKLYSEGFVPVPPGRYNVLINVPGYRTYTQAVVAVKGSLSPVVAKLDPIAGYLTVLDGGNAEGAKVFLDNNLIGSIPVYRHKARIGNHVVKFEKQGFKSEQEIYRQLIEDEMEAELAVIMTGFKQVSVTTVPSGAEVMADNQRVGFSPCKFTLRAGDHKVVVRKIGFLEHTETFSVRETGYNSDRDINLVLEQTFPVSVVSEKTGLKVRVSRRDTVVSFGFVTPAKLELPYGKYDIELLNENGKKRFSGSVKFTKDREKVKLPCYSWGTFTTLVADYYGFSKPQAKIAEAPYYTHLASAQFGRFNFLPGLSTAIARASVFALNKDKKEDKVLYDETATHIRKDYTGGLSVLFLNYEFRMGGAIFRNLDIAALGVGAYYPQYHGLITGLNFDYLDGTEFFVGLELATRISTLNFNIRIGQEIYNGRFNYCVDTQKNGSSSTGVYTSQKFNMSNFGITVGVTLGNTIHSSNNMLRLWQKPLNAKY